MNNSELKEAVFNSAKKLQTHEVIYYANDEDLKTRINNTVDSINVSNVVSYEVKTVPYDWKYCLRIKFKCNNNVSLMCEFFFARIKYEN